MLQRDNPYPYSTTDRSTQKRRLNRQRLLETALPCSLIAAILVAGLFTVGHMGQKARAQAKLAKQQQHASTLFSTDAAPMRLSSQELFAESASSSRGEVHAGSKPQQQQQQQQQRQEQQQQSRRAGTMAAASAQLSKAEHPVAQPLSRKAQARKGKAASAVLHP